MSWLYINKHIVLYIEEKPSIPWFFFLRSRAESNRRIRVLQTLALPLGDWIKVGQVGLEPTPHNWNDILSVARIPISPLALIFTPMGYLQAMTIRAKDS